MNRLTENKIVLITRRTRLDEMIARFNTARQAKFYVEHLRADFSDYESEHAQYHRAISETTAILNALGRVQMIDRAYLPNFIFGPQDTAVALGQDGLVANTLKYLSGQPLIGVNPDPARWDGALLPFGVSDLRRIVPEVIAEKRDCREVTMAQAELDNGQALYAVNDLFIGPKSHTSARYVIRCGGRCEPQSSSGLIVSTGLGSTGWFTSLMTGATAIVNQICGRAVSLEEQTQPGFPWDARWLYFTVREPFPSKTSATMLVFGRVTPDEPLELESRMAENGVIFSDGIEEDFLEFNSGAHARITVAEKRGRLVV
jgi:NAD kinase